MPTATINSVVAAAEHDLIPPGTDITGYIVDGEIGHGGMGVVYSATHKVIGKRAAIKVLRRDMIDKADLVDRFIQEARSVNQIGHPNIVNIFAFDRLADGRPFLVMDLLVGESLRKRIKRGALDVSEATSVLDETASALAAAHDKGFIHRDLKPDNVFLVPHDGRWPEVKLLDFGLAKLLPTASGGDVPFRTQTGVMLGTPDYMAPELVRRRPDFDHRVDIYALGVMAFESLAGERPFPALDGSFEKLQAICETPAPEISTLVPRLPRDLAYLIDAMLLKDPNSRPSLADLRAGLKRLRAVLPSMSMSMGIAMPGPGAPMGVSIGGLALRVGAEPILPDDDMIQTLPRSGADPEEFKKTLTAPPRTRSSPSLGVAPSAVSSAGLAPPNLQHAMTHIGVPPPVRADGVPSRVQTAPPSIASAPAPAPATKPRSGGTIWLVLAALLAVGAGIALALAIAT